jgi:hypothetical protein
LVEINAFKIDTLSRVRRSHVNYVNK